MFLLTFFRCIIIVTVHCCEVLQKPSKCDTMDLLQVIVILQKDSYCLISIALATINRVMITNSFAGVFSF